MKERFFLPSTITRVKTHLLPLWPKVETTFCSSSFSRLKPTGESQSQSQTISFPTLLETNLSPLFSPNASIHNLYSLFAPSLFPLEISHSFQRNHRLLRPVQRLRFRFQSRATRQSSRRESHFGQLSELM